MTNEHNKDDGFSKKECVYLGRRLLQGNKLGNCWILLKLFNDINKDDNFTRTTINSIDEIASTFDAKKSTPILGGVYLIEVKLEENRIKSARIASKKWCRKITHSIIAAFEVQDATCYQDYKSLKDEGKARRENTVLENELSRLRNLYIATSFRDKLAFEIMVIKYLRTGVK